MAQTNDVQDSVVGHLKELRPRLIKALAVPVLLFLGFFPFMPSLVHFLQTDLIPTWQLYLFSPAEAVLVQTKLPKLGRCIGRTIKEFREGQKEITLTEETKGETSHPPNSP